MESSSSNSKSKLLIFIIGGVIVFGALFFVVLSLYKAEGVATVTEFAPEEAKKPGHLVIDAKVVSIDPIKGDISIRLQFSPVGKSGRQRKRKNVVTGFRNHATSR